MNNESALEEIDIDAQKADVENQVLDYICAIQDEEWDKLKSYVKVAVHDCPGLLTIIQELHSGAREIRRLST